MEKNSKRVRKQGFKVVGKYNKLFEVYHIKNETQLYNLGFISV